MRPAWAHSCGCKSRRKLITANEVKRNCVRATERGKEAWSISCEPMNKNRIEGAAEQGERAMNREALVIKAKWRKSGGCAETVSYTHLDVYKRQCPNTPSSMPDRMVTPSLICLAA